MDAFRLPPLIEELLDSTEDLSDLKEEKPSVLEVSLKDEKENRDKEIMAAEKGQYEEEKEVMKEEEEKHGQEGEDNKGKELEEMRTQMLQLLQDLEDTREVSQKHEESMLELQGMLEEERLASAHQAESFTRQIQRLQAQLRSVQEEMDSLEEEKESELEEAQEELRSAQEEVLALQQAAEEEAAERENDIASLQEELCRLRAELQRLHATTQEYELEVTTLRAEILMKSRNTDTYEALNKLTDEFVSLTNERQSLADGNEHLNMKVDQLQQKQADMSEDVYLAVRAAGDTHAQRGQGTGDAYITLSEHPDSIEDQESSLCVELDNLKVQLQRAEEKAHEVQKQCDGLKGELVDLQQQYDSSQREREALAQELQQCQAELRKLLERGTQQPPVLSAPFIGIIVIVALIWCWWEELAS
ncbi:coiled-coil domain-containing protein 136-like isoform 1-T1 [Synchiropus picturatus]